jgi:hypothetical protein
VIGGSYYNITASSNIKTPNAQTPLAFGMGNFTAEAWVYPTATPSSSFNGIIDTRNGGGLAFGLFVSATATFQVYMEFCAGGSNLVLTSAANVLRLNSWSHIAVTRSGTAVNVWVNGVSVSSGTGGQNLSDGYGMIGATNDSTSTNYFRGYISNVRLVKGTAVYTAAFTPPTAPLTAITNTSLLLNFTNAGIFDNAMMNDLVTVGDAQISTAVVKYGTGSMKFDGTGDYLTAPDNVWASFGTGDFTVEAWVWLDSTVNPGRPDNLKTTTLFSTGSGSANDCSFAIRGSTSVAGIGLELYQASPAIGIGVTSTVPTNSWAHIAFVRSGTTIYGFVNGVRSTLGTTSATIGSGVSPKIGFSNTTSYSNQFKGYIDDLRITKGFARYTANFTPPTAAFPNL